jgi:hypothetical protein
LRRAQSPSRSPVFGSGYLLIPRPVTRISWSGWHHRVRAAPLRTH